MMCLLLMLTSFKGFTQENNLGDEQVDVVKAYQPTLSDAFKISDIPGRDTTVIFIPSMKYNIDQIKHPTVYTISPIKAVRIKDDNLKELYRGFIKAGYGTKNTPYAEIFYNSLRSKDFDAGIHLNHLSSSGKIKGYGFPGMSETGIELYGSKFLDNHTLKGNVGFDRYVYHYYGYMDPPDIFSKSETKHSFDDIHGKFELISNETNKKNLRYSTHVGFHSFSDNKDHTENNLNFGASLAKEINKGELIGDIELDFISYDTPLKSNEGRHIFRVNPRYRFDLEPVVLTFGANIAVEANDKTDFHIYPFARVDYLVVENTMSLFAELTGDLKRNSFRSVSLENPFMEGPVAMLNSDNKFNLSGGVNLKLDKQLQVNLSGGLRSIDDDMFYVNLPAEAPTTIVKYDVGYLNNKQTFIQAEAIFEQVSKMNLSLLATFISNSPSGLDKPLFRPNFRMRLKGNYTIADKIRVTTEWEYVSQQNALSYDPQNDFISVDGYVDGSLGVDYLYSKVLTVFLNFNNITASKYSRWYNYPSYRFMAMAGLTYSF